MTSRSIDVSPSLPSKTKIKASASSMASRDCSRISAYIRSSEVGTRPPGWMGEMADQGKRVGLGRPRVGGWNSWAGAMDWDGIDTILLDLDGTLLDRAFDDHFYFEVLPGRYAEANGLSVDIARDRLVGLY